MKILIVFLSFIILNSCSQKENIEEIKVGMTYDEVEKILDKPSSILRGANEFSFDVDNHPYEITKRIDWDTTDILHNPKRWILKNEITTIGNLIYVTWIYNDRTKLDTFFVVLNTFKEIIDTIKSTTPIYYIGKRQVTKSEYDNWDFKPKADGNKPLASLGGGKRVVYHHSERVDRKEIKVGKEVFYYEVKFKYCIIFDSSSGRVTNSGYYPYDIKELKKVESKFSDNKSA